MFNQELVSASTFSNSVLTNWTTYGNCYKWLCLHWLWYSAVFFQERHSAVLTYWSSWLFKIKLSFHWTSRKWSAIAEAASTGSSVLLKKERWLALRRTRSLHPKLDQTRLQQFSILCGFRSKECGRKPSDPTFCITSFGFQEDLNPFNSYPVASESCGKLVVNSDSSDLCLNDDARPARSLRWKYTVMNVRWVVFFRELFCLISWFQSALFVVLLIIRSCNMQHIREHR